MQRKTKITEVSPKKPLQFSRAGTRVITEVSDNHPKTGEHFEILNNAKGIFGNLYISKRSGKKQTGDNFYEKDDTFKFTIHVSVAQRPSSVESRIKLKVHLN